MPRFGHRLLAALAATLGLTPALALSPVHADSATTPGPLAISLVTAGPAVVGQPLQLTLSVTNTSDAPITSPIVGAGFPLADKLSAPLPNPDQCGRGGNAGVSMGFSCAMPDLQPGATVSVPFGLIPADGLSMGVNVAASGYVNGAWRSESTGLLIPVAPAATDVQVSGSASTGSPKAGSSFRYTLQVKNGSSHAAYGVSQSQTLPDGVVARSATSSNGAPCTVTPSAVTCALGDLTDGTPVVITVGATAPTTAGVFTMTATAQPTNADTQTSNNRVSVTVQVKP
jgi:uncharacterized repeat protein (TIGR01451 family)